MFHISLAPEDLGFFYKILYLCEKETHLTGYKYNNVPSEIKDRVLLNHDAKKKKIVLNFLESPNTLCFKGRNVSIPLLKHLRHSFAHACVEREGEYYVINSQMNPKCQICGKVKREDLMSLIEAILITKKEE